MGVDEQPSKVRWLVFALGCAISWMLYLHRYTFGLIKPKLQEEFGWTPTELGQLDAAFSSCYVIFQFPAGILADALGAHLFLGGIIIAWSIALALVALTSELTTMRLARAAFGAGQAGTFAALSRITRSWFPLAVRTSVQGWIGVFFGRMGGASANILFGSLMIGVLHLSWQTAIYVLAAGGVALGIGFLVYFRDTPRQHGWVNEAEAELIEGLPASSQSAERLSVSAMLRRMRPRAVFNLLSLSLQSWLSTLADNIYVAWIPLFLWEVHKLDYATMGVFSMLPLLGGACGGAVGGWLNDWLIHRTGNRRWSRSAIGLAGKGIAGLLLFSALFYYDRPYVFCGMLFLVKFFGDWSLATSWGTVTDIGGRTSATVFAFNNSVASTAEIVAPLMYGYIIQFYEWRDGFIIVTAAYGLCAASWLLVNCTIPLIDEQPAGQRNQ